MSGSAVLERKRLTLLVLLVAAWPLCAQERGQGNSSAEHATMHAAGPLSIQDKDRKGSSAEHASPCTGHEDTCRIAEGALALAEKKVPAIGIATNAAGAGIAGGEGGAPAQFEVGGKVAGLLKEGVETGKDVLTSSIGRRITGMSAAEAAGLHESVEIGGKVLGPAAEVAAFCAEGLRAVESCHQGQYLDATTHAGTAIAGAAANALCPGAGSTCANASIGVGNMIADDPELSAARSNELHNPGGTEALQFERAQAEEQAADALDAPARAVKYRKSGGTEVERGVGDAMSTALSASSRAAGAGFTPVGKAVSPDIDDLVAEAVNETASSTSARFQRSEGSSRLAEHGEQAFETMRSASAQASAAVNSMLSRQMASQQSYALQSQSHLQANSGAGTAQNCSLARQQEGANKQYITDNSAVNDGLHRQAVAAAEEAQRATVSWISSNCH